MKDNMNKDWRPDDWFNRHTPKVLEAGFMRQGMMALANAYEDGASQMLAARDKWWIENIEKAWDEYVVYPITIDQKKSEGCTRVTFNRKPEFPEFISKWQSPQAIFGDE